MAILSYMDLWIPVINCYPAIALTGSIFVIYGTKKSLKIPKGQSESVNRRTNNTIAKK
jgi:hypothetical protein